MFKCQLFHNSNNKKRVPKVYKCPQIDKSDNKKEDLSKYEDKVDEYVLFSLISLFFPFLKKSNHLVN